MFEKGSRKVIPCENEIILLEFRKLIQLPINFLNGGCIILLIEPYTTIRDIIDEILLKLQKSHLFEFYGLYEMHWQNNQISFEDYLENDAFILDRVNSFERSRVSNDLPKKKLKFFFRIRIFYKFDEKDLDSISLLYSHFFFDILHEKLEISNETLEKLIGIALAIDYGPFDMEKSRKMALNLEKYVPLGKLMTFGIKFWFENAMNSYEKAEEIEEFSLKRAFFKVLKENDLFFAHHFRGFYAKIVINEVNEGVFEIKKRVLISLRPLILEFFFEESEENMKIRYEFNKINKWGLIDAKTLIIYTNDLKIHAISCENIKEIEFLIKNYIRIAIQFSLP